MFGFDVINRREDENNGETMGADDFSVLQLTDRSELREEWRPSSSSSSFGGLASCDAKRRRRRARAKHTSEHIEQHTRARTELHRTEPNQMLANTENVERNNKRNRPRLLPLCARHRLASRLHFVCANSLKFVAQSREATTSSSTTTAALFGFVIIVHFSYQPHGRRTLARQPVVPRLAPCTNGIFRSCNLMILTHVVQFVFCRRCKILQLFHGQLDALRILLVVVAVVRFLTFVSSTSTTNNSLQ